MKYLSFLLLLIAICSCDSNRIYEDYNDMEKAFWHLDSIQTFSFRIEDTSKPYNVLSTFRNSSSYPFYNLYFQYDISDSLGNTFIKKLKEVSLFDSKTGNPYGDGLGDLFDHSFMLEQNHYFPYVGAYSISLKQYMRRDTLPFILSVGVQISYSEIED